MKIKMSDKPAIVVALNGDVTARSLVQSNAMEELRKQFNVIYLCSDSVSIELTNSFRVDFLNSRGRWVKLVDYYLWELSYFKYLRRFTSIRERRKDFRVIMLSKKQRTLLTVLSLPVICKIIMPLMENLVVQHNKEIYRFLKKINPKIIIIPGAQSDSFGLDVIKCARLLSIKTIMTVMHWDFFSLKGLLRAAPDIISVWGEQMCEMAVKLHKIPQEKIRITGVPQFEIYKNSIDMNIARKNLGLPVDKKLLLFAGTGVPFDEMSILEEIDSLIGTELFSDVIVLYRPHPKKHKSRKNEKDFNEYKFKNIELDPENILGKKKIGKTSLEYYINLLYSIDGLISPFSTMTLEAALCGKPCMTIAFSDNLHTWKFERALTFKHLLPLQEFDWVSLCKNKNDIKKSLVRLLKTIDKSDISLKIKKDIQYIVYSDKNSYSKRLFNLVSEHIGKV